MTEGRHYALVHDDEPYHMQHHHKTPHARYGVSSPLWDLVFGSMPR